MRNIKEQKIKTENKKLWNGIAKCSFYANHSRVPRAVRNYIKNNETSQ